jgi:hypothetical protein
VAEAGEVADGFTAVDCDTLGAGLVVCGVVVAGWITDGEVEGVGAGVLDPQPAMKPKISRITTGNRNFFIFTSFFLTYLARQ